MGISIGDEFIVERLGPDSLVLKRVNLRALMQDIIEKAKNIYMDKLEAEIEEEANRLADENTRFLIDTNLFVAQAVPHFKPASVICSTKKPYYQHDQIIS